MGRFHEFPKQEIKPFSPLESPPVFVRIRLFSQGALSPQSDRLCAGLASIYTYRYLYNKVNCYLFGLDCIVLDAFGLTAYACARDSHVFFEPYQTYQT